MKLRTLTLGLCLSIVLGACGRKEAAPPAPASPAATAATANDKHLPPGIDWFAGSVEDAFAAAKSGSKPLFLYWGAEWCPPCAQIKATIFSRREFQDRSKLFVSVYLDGDTPSAQKYGEQFGVVGYPTMILFRPDGTELTRLPGGVDIARYARILDVALAAARPVKDLLAAARSGGELSQDDWRLLAYYDWPTDLGRVLADDQRTAAFRQLAQRCPPEIEADCARLFFAYLSAAAADSKDGRKAMDGLERAEARAKLLRLIDQPSVQQANVENLLLATTDVIGVLSDAGTPERRQLTIAWSGALDRLAALSGEAVLTPKEQLYVVRSRVMLAKLDAPGRPLPPALLEQARQTVARIDATVKDPVARTPAINAAANLYFEADMETEANQLLSAELGKSPSPYYFMLDLADLAEKSGRKKEAVDWLARAYHDAKGPATRFQWGYSYLVGLIEMTPGDVAGIERAGLEVLGELDGSPDAFYQRTRMRLEQLSGQLLDWGKSGEAAKAVDTLRARTQEICRKLPEADDGRAACEGFLRRG
jgi:thioredoxin-related protein